jgi:hypothetical protein
MAFVMKPWRLLSSEARVIVDAGCVPNEVGGRLYHIETERDHNILVHTVQIAAPHCTPFALFTVEDHGRHWRVRGDGRYDRWHSVPKGEVG